jgi:hypothetical protein
MLPIPPVTRTTLLELLDVVLELLEPPPEIIVILELVLVLVREMEELLEDEEMIIPPKLSPITMLFSPMDCLLLNFLALTPILQVVAKVQPAQIQITSIECEMI